MFAVVLVFNLIAIFIRLTVNRILLYLSVSHAISPKIFPKSGLKGEKMPKNLKNAKKLSFLIKTGV